MGDTHEDRLPDRRRVAYADHGDRAGPTVLSGHGTPECRLIDPAVAELAAPVPGAELRVLSGVGHGMAGQVWPEAFGWLVGQPR
jgi:hypothetical protein